MRSQQMAGKDSNYVPGWDCHGLPIEWKVEEENYRKKGKAKPDFSDAAAMVAFRRECRAYAEHWLSVQREEFKRLGVVGDWDHPYSTMTYPAEAQIAREILKFAANGLLYRGSKPVMWSVVEKTALAEAEVEYEEHTSDTVYVAFPLQAATDGEAWRKANRSSSGRRRHGRCRAIAPSPSPSASPTASIGSSTPPKTIGPSLATSICSPRSSPTRSSPPRSVDGLRAHRARSPADRLRELSCAHPLHERAATTSPSRCSPATTSPTTPARASSTPRRATAARTSSCGWRAGDCSPSAAYRYAHSLHGRRERRLHRRGAGLRRQARHHRQGREGRRQQGGHQGADRRAAR